MNLLFKLNKRYTPIIIWLVFFGFWLSFYYLMGYSTKPPEGDEGDYLERGIRFTEIGFSSLSDGYRPPLLPIIIAMLSKIWGTESILGTARVFNIALVSIIPAIWVSLYIHSVIEKKYLAMAVITGLWPAFFLFSYFILAEAVSFFLLNILFIIALLIKRKNTISIYLSLLAAASLSLLFYAKANNILVSIPIGIYILFFGTQKILSKFLQVCGIALLTFALILPWMFFLHNQSGSWYLTSTGGINLLVGTGYHNFEMEPDNNAIHQKYLSKSNLGSYPILSDKQLQELNHSEDTFKKDTISKRFAFEIWSSDTKRTAIFSFYKIAHSMGFSFRGLMDFVVAGLLALTSLISVAFLINKRHVDVVCVHFLMTLIGALVAFFWLPNIRFKTFYFDTTALLLIACLIEDIYFYFQQRKFPSFPIR